jgi:hypothetical protein
MEFDIAVVGIQLTLVGILIGVNFGDLSPYLLLSLLFGAVGTVLVILEPQIDNANN